ncbi:hypothetical protein GEZ73_01025 [Streptococcus mitis]|jgi:hypothetical protein|uniref:Lipoprotein n=3 Tax=Streptococcus mitis TaxID=28037 RepID=I0SYD6_STRMT|nr:MULTISPECIES: hypothetical protein [Streptococcus]EFN99438.1 hypothetical protein SMSK564_0233 [Streptococcus mitis SK564]EID28389.1 hypothetical protein HMPREF1048_1175 [Streptococcus mitis SK575]MQP59479.1 hypothetical protein [Streptococcus mitis]MQP69031.1 hypothetical protein [Streptococcus mitis]MQP70956.1 hypothetical protein [Streptococcus mitis]
MKKIIYIALIFVAGLLAFFFFGKQMITKENTIKPTVELTVYTLSSSDTEKWNKVRQVETEEAIYFITVKEVESSEEVFSNLIANGAAFGFGVREEEVKKFNNGLGDTIEDSKHNKLIEIEFFTFSDADEGFVVANFDYGKEELNSQKKDIKELYKKIYESFKEKNK